MEVYPENCRLRKRRRRRRRQYSNVRIGLGGGGMLKSGEGIKSKALP